MAERRTCTRCRKTASGAGRIKHSFGCPSDADDFLLNEKLKAYEGEEAKIEKREREEQRID